jgi:hypothetical protein
VEFTGLLFLEIALGRKQADTGSRDIKSLCLEGANVVVSILNGPFDRTNSMDLNGRVKGMEGVKRRIVDVRNKVGNERSDRVRSTCIQNNWCELRLMSFLRSWVFGLISERRVSRWGLRMSRGIKVEESVRNWDVCGRIRLEKCGQDRRISWAKRTSAGKKANTDGVYSASITFPFDSRKSRTA